MSSYGQVFYEEFSKEPLKINTLTPSSILRNIVFCFNMKQKQYEMPVLKFLLEENKNDSDMMNNFADDLFNKSLLDWSFASVAVELIIWLVENVNDGQMIRNRFLKNLQKLYSDQKERNLNETKRWMGCVAMLIHSMYNMLLPVPGVMRMKALVDTSFQALMICFREGANDEEIECASELLTFSYEVFKTEKDESSLGKMLDLISELISNNGRNFKCKPALEEFLQKNDF